MYIHVFYYIQILLTTIHHDLRDISRFLTTCLHVQVVRLQSKSGYSVTYTQVYTKQVIAKTLQPVWPQVLATLHTTISRESMLTHT